MNALNALFTEHEQAVWLDFVARGFVAKGELQAWSSATTCAASPPTRRSSRRRSATRTTFDDSLSKAALDHSDARVIDLYEGLAIADIQAAADVLRKVYDTSDGATTAMSASKSPRIWRSTPRRRWPRPAACTRRWPATT